jgi:hypothetical protein
MKNCIIAVLTGFLLGSNAYASSFTCSGTDLHGNRISLNVDELGNDVTNIVFTQEHFSGSTGEVAHEQFPIGPAHCESSGFARVTCFDNDGHLRLQDSSPNRFRINVSEPWVEEYGFEPQFSSCSPK